VAHTDTHIRTSGSPYIIYIYIVAELVGEEECVAPAPGLAYEGELGNPIHTYIYIGARPSIWGGVG